MGISLIIELKTFNLLLAVNIQKSIGQEKNGQTRSHAGDAIKLNLFLNFIKEEI